MNGVTLLLIKDGRDDALAKCLASAGKYLPDFERQVVVDDADHRLGFAGAIQEGWEQIETPWVFHLEQDFIFECPIPVDDMIFLLRSYPWLRQVSLKRQPVSREEKAAGGIVELHRREFQECKDPRFTWIEHRRYFTTNPSVYSVSLCHLGWPREEGSEAAFTDRLLRDPFARFAIWGSKAAPPMTIHIGERVGHGY